MLRVKKVLEELADMPGKAGEKHAIVILKKEGFAKMQKRQGRATEQGKIFSYVHHTAKVGVLLELLVETDFVAKNELFNELGNNIALQIASMNPKNEKELLSQEFIKDTSKKINDLIKETITKTGENIKIDKFTRYEIGA